MKRLLSFSLGVTFTASLAFGCMTSGTDDGASGETAQALTVDCSHATNWASGVAYAVGNVVLFNGAAYQCIQAHTSQPDWTPPAVPALWSPVTCSGGTGTDAGGGGTDAGGTQAPAAPTNLAVTGTTSSSASLSWTASAGPVSGYNVYQNGSKIGSVTGTTDTVTGLAASTTFNFAVTAFNAAGESAKSNQVSATTTSTPPVTGIPKHELTGYWQDFNNGAAVLRLSAVPANYDIIAVAFGNADPSSPGGVTFSVDSGLSSALGGYTDANFISDVQTLHGRGKKVVLSIGGQNGNVDLSSSGNVANFVNSLAGLISQFGFDGVDIDLENGINVANLTTGLQQLQQRVGSGFILTMAPQTIDVQPGGAYLQLINNVKSIITVVHTQYYNSGTMLGRDGKVYAEGTEDFETALADLLLETLRPDQVALGLPASGSAAGGGVVAPSVVNAALDCLAQGTNCGSYKPVAQYPTIRGAMTWSINWDVSNGSNFANTVKPHLNGMP